MQQETHGWREGVTRSRDRGDPGQREEIQGWRKGETRNRDGRDRGQRGEAEKEMEERAGRADGVQSAGAGGDGGTGCAAGLGHEAPARRPTLPAMG